ncbi:hypothetical protein Cs7R123_62890 [Catellatospora sp. TT07R-123]|uniref:hypothetical protein n=1 Tax=Catellatospora sp. TT07R-123 TaxID=2733863 RepID=UPI001B27D3EE|nr:hypothetical protein [Catellatospora sp. TT07R-123]GHJ48947.1 hypothetical protein Cs7R123_62890 [Catellatospora sp. TT07R-123]
MTTLPSAADDGDRPLFADSPALDQPLDPPVVRRRGDLPPPPRPPGPLPAPPPAHAAPPAPAPVPVAAAAAGVLVGRVNSQVTETHQPHRFLGFGVLVAVAVAAIAAVVVYAAGGALAGLLCAAVVLMVLAFGFGRLLGGWTVVFAMIARGLIWLVSTIVALSLRGAGAAARGAGRSSGFSYDLVVQRFQVQLVSGEYITCLLAGRIADGDLRRDDHVGLTGRTRPDHYLVRTVDVYPRAGGTAVRRISASQPPGFRLLRWLDRGAFVLAALLVAVLVAGIAGAVRQ